MDGNPHKPLPPAPQSHTFTSANGVTRSVSRRDESIACTPEWILGEARKQILIAGPMVCVALLQYLLIVVSVMFVGHLGELELASASIASSFAGVTGTSLLFGLASALDTLCGQAFGAKQYHMLGIYMQRVIFVLNLVCIPVAVVWYNMDALLMALGQNAQIAGLAGMYARYLIPSLFGMATLQPLVKFLQAQSVVLPMALFSATTTLGLHIPLCYLLIFKLGVGYRGAAIATSISNWLNVVLLTLYIKHSAACRREDVDEILTGGVQRFAEFFQACDSVDNYDLLGVLVVRGLGIDVGVAPESIAGNLHV